MKAIFTLLLVFSLNAAAVAQHTKNYDKVIYIQMDIVLVTGLSAVVSHEKIGMAKGNDVARLYRYPNSRVKKALSFKTKKDRPKLA